MDAKTEKPPSAADWMAELSGSELTPARRAALADWLRESPTHVRAMIEHTLIDYDLRNLSIPREQLETWATEAKAVANIERLTPPASAFLPPLPLWERAGVRGFFAAAASILLALATFLWWQNGRYSTGLGEQRILTLDDGSVVTLNTESTLRVSFSGKKRKISLIEGEAFFNVALDKSRPFEVVSDTATVKALGTQFNVRLAHEATVVSVLDGRVAVSEEKGTGGEVLLSAGEQVRIDKSALPVTHNPIETKSPRSAASQAVAWTQGRLEFDKTPLGDVIEEFRRYRKLNVHIADPGLREIKLTGSFDARDLQSALDYIATLPGIEIEQTDDGVVIRRK